MALVSPVLAMEKLQPYTKPSMYNSNQHDALTQLKHIIRHYWIIAAHFNIACHQMTFTGAQTPNVLHWLVKLFRYQHINNLMPDDAQVLVDYVTVGSCYSASHFLRQGIVWTHAELLSFKQLQRFFVSKRIFVSKKTHFEMSFTKLRLYFHGLFVLIIAHSFIYSKKPSGKYLHLTNWWFNVDLHYDSLLHLGCRYCCHNILCISYLVRRPGEAVIPSTS